MFLIEALNLLCWIHGEIVCVDLKQLTPQYVAEGGPNYGCSVVDTYSTEIK